MTHAPCLSPRARLRHTAWRASPATGGFRFRDGLRTTRAAPARADIAYRPGADVHGRPVAPADLGDGTQIVLPERFAIPITVDMAERLGILPLGSVSLHSGEIAIGTVEGAADGRATFNGQPLQSAAATALAEACQRVAPRR